MKRLLFVALLFISAAISAQNAPQKLSYQAVARNTGGSTINNQSIGIKAEILDANQSTVLYAESHTVTTNGVGLFTIQVGGGTTVISGTFSSIDWGGGNKFIRTSVDLAGGTNYQLMGVSQLLSVPYALYAQKTNLVAGTGISITGGNTIAATNGSQWINHTNGIYYNSNKVGIGTTPSSNYPLTVYQANSGVGGSIANFTSNDTWHSAIAIQNTTSSQQFTLIVGGSSNIELKPGNFGIYNGTTTKWPLTINGANNNIGLGDNSAYPTLPKSTLHLKTGDVYIEEITKGIIMKSPNGNCWRVTVDNSGNLVTSSITCPN